MTQIVHVKYRPRKGFESLSPARSDATMRKMAELGKMGAAKVVAKRQQAKRIDQALAEARSELAASTPDIPCTGCYSEPCICKSLWE